MQTILIIDDANTIRDVIKDVLHSEWPNLRIIEGENGAEGIEKAILEQPDLILMDGNMPIMTGYQMAQLFKMMPSVSSIPLVTISGANPTNPMVVGMQEICDAYLPKPFGAEQLIAVVKPFLDEY